MVLDYIKKLLYVHDCVVIPEFGGFITSYAPASIHPVKHLFRPPSKQIAFNESLKTNDGLLMHELSIGERITREEAADHIRDFVKSVEATLASDRMVKLDEIGTLRLNEEDKIEFEPSNHINFLEESYGFTELYCKPVERKEEDMNRKPYPPQNRAVPPGRQPIRRKPNPEKSKHKAEKDMSEEENKEGKKISPVLIVIPIIVLLLIAVGVSLNYIDDGKYYKQIASLITNQDEEVDAASMEDDESAADEDQEGVLADAGDDMGVDSDEETSTENESRDASATPAGKGNIHIIAGVFKNKENALEMQIKHSGSEILEHNNFYRVSVTRYHKLDDAIADIESLRADYGPNAWILKE